MSAKQKHGVVVGGHTICVTGAATRAGKSPRSVAGSGRHVRREGTTAPMTDAAASISRPPPIRTVRLALPFAGRRIQAMLAVYVVVLFVFSATVLDFIGLRLFGD